MQRWYEIQVERYLKVFPDRKLVMHGPDEVNVYLEKTGLRPGQEGWQHQLIVDAIQNLPELVRLTGHF